MVFQLFMVHRGGILLTLVIPCLFLKRHYEVSMKYLAMKFGTDLYAALRMK